MPQPAAVFGWDGSRMRHILSLSVCHLVLGYLLSRSGAVAAFFALFSFLCVRSMSLIYM